MNTRTKIVVGVVMITILLFVAVGISFVTLNFANSAIKYTVTFNSNGGSEVEPQIVEEGETATEPKFPTKEGLSFYGWFLNPKTEKDLDKIYDFSTPITEDTTLTGLWSAQLKVLTEGRGELGIGCNGETPVYCAENPILVAYEVSIIGIYDTTVELIEKADQGWKFAYWKDEDTGEVYSTDEKIKVKIDKNINLIAVFDQM